MVLRPEQEAEAEAIFTKWGLISPFVGKTTDDLRFSVLHQAKRWLIYRSEIWVMKHQIYDRPYVEPGKHSDLLAENVEAPQDYNAALFANIGFTQYVFTPLGVGTI